MDSPSTTHPASLPIDELLRDCEIKRTRGSGPGGQHRNKVETAIVITHRPSGIFGQASERRSQKENREVAIGRLRIALALGIRTKPVESDCRQPSTLWKQRVSGRKINVSPEHQDFATLLAELLDWLVDAEFEASEIAEPLGCSATQIVRWLAREQAAFEWVNRERGAIGKHPYKAN